MKYEDPFLGEIELERIAVNQKAAMGMYVTEEIYKDDYGNFYVNVSGLNESSEPLNVPIFAIPKSVIDRIIEWKETEE